MGSWYYVCIHVLYILYRYQPVTVVSFVASILDSVVIHVHVHVVPTNMSHMHSQLCGMRYIHVYSI